MAYDLNERQSISYAHKPNAGEYRVHIEDCEFRGRFAYSVSDCVTAEGVRLAMVVPGGLSERPPLMTNHWEFYQHREPLRQWYEPIGDEE